MWMERELTKFLARMTWWSAMFSSENGSRSRVSAADVGGAGLFFVLIYFQVQDAKWI